MTTRGPPATLLQVVPEPFPRRVERRDEPDYKADQRGDGQREGEDSSVQANRSRPRQSGTKRFERLYTYWRYRDSNCAAEHSQQQPFRYDLLDQPGASRTQRAPDREFA